MYYNTECGCGQHGHGGRPRIGHGARWGHRGYWGAMHQSGHCHCGCQNASRFGSFGQRRFISKEEVIAHLEEYLKQLKAEAAGVEEHIAELKKKQS